MLILAVVMVLLISCSADYSSLMQADQLATAAVNEEAEVPQASRLTNPATAEPPKVQLTATIWQQSPQVPILMYHRFDPAAGATSYSYTTSLTDLKEHLTLLYEAGFSLVSLPDWLAGSINLSTGRRPLIITFDDLYYGDQLSLDAAGQPTEYCGIGHLWQFFQKHPDFNFHLALCYNLGDKAYANTYTNGTFTVGEGWHQDRAEAIAWGIENDAIPINHFFNHPFLDQLSPTEIEWELAENDRALREALALVGKEAYAENLPNILALPYMVWPATDEGKRVLFDYISPEGTPVSAILAGGTTVSVKFLHSPFSQEFDPWHIPRMIASWEAINLILNNLDEIPVADHCELGIFNEDTAAQPDLIMQAIFEQINNGTCKTGVYWVGGQAFKASSSGVIQLDR